MKIKRYYFRIELTGVGKNKAEAWQDAIRTFAEDPGKAPPLEETLIKGSYGQPILGTQYTIDAGRVKQ